MASLPREPVGTRYPGERVSLLRELAQRRYRETGDRTWVEVKARVIEYVLDQGMVRLGLLKEGEVSE